MKYNKQLKHFEKIKNHSKTVILLLGVSLSLWNCDKDDTLEINTKTNTFVNVQTVSFKDAKNFFNVNKSTNIAAKGTEPLTLNPDWNTLDQQELFNTNALLTNVKTSVNRNGDFSSELFFIKIDGQIKNVIYTIYKDSIDNKGNIINARFFLNHTNGDFIDGYQIVNVNTLKRLTIKYNSSSSKNSLLAKSDTKDIDCWNTDNLPDSQTFDTVWIEGSSGGGGPLGGWSGFTGSTRGSFSTAGDGSNSNATNAGDYGVESSSPATGSYTSNDYNSPTLTSREIKELAGAIVVIPPTPEIITDNTDQITIINTSKPIFDINEYLKCINLNQRANITIYVDQPVANSETISSLLDKAGHSFISINQNGNISTFGFYPDGHASPYSPIQPSVLGDDSNHSYDVSITFPVTPTILKKIINYSLNYNSIYDLNNYNCTDFAIEIGNLAGLNLPDCFQSWINDGGGSNPASFGQYIRNGLNNSSVAKNKTGGTSPLNIKNCQ